MGERAKPARGRNRSRLPMRWPAPLDWSFPTRLASQLRRLRTAVVRDPGARTMASEATADRTGADRGVESATPDGVQREIKNGLPASATEVTSACIPPAWGRPLSEADYAVLAASWITPEIANEAMLRRVDTFDGRE